ncbi:hypothetical protein BDV40DRAFT_310183 [Aspergillus tamarii]|uniref:FAD/NAD(P)-binding domain-containing protein n=1 Tax=Aspergillus tamarii TaxID=41984 RepID=A0A5N6VC57_ASPTM|nr:hypothetical protein BDV40DRAFT_310183 [Aspergillus tamarii]
MTLFDVLVIGGGPAGLSVVTTLARQLHRVVLFDSGMYRNALTEHMHNVATWDHKSPEEYRREARKQILSRYDTIYFEDTEVQIVERTVEGYFKAFDVHNQCWTGRKLVLAHGVRDIFPDIEGYEKCWATGILHCLFCHGFEERGCASVGVLAVGDIGNVVAAMRVARMARRFADSVTIYTHGAEGLSQMLEDAAEGTGIKVDKRPISRFVKGASKSEVQIVFEDGMISTEGFLSHKPKTQINGPFADQLGLELTPDGDIKTTEPFYSTSVPGVFAAGDCAGPLKAVVTAMTSGSLVAAVLAGQLQSELYATKIVK